MHYLQDNSIRYTEILFLGVQIECSCNATYTTQTLRSLICRSDFGKIRSKSLFVHVPFKREMFYL